ncbi:FxSxx-COOH cyclophane-containing RiPP peptide [Mangrovihabitans endophyticus]|uniref:FXSXX-COOH protein n=1 Tax=Mangrovihabitans endophyticus TaxID=1751298 RepID=A0A8J3FP53_9ACTN|nr:FxSxx-COOH cyclophane-containing RiPP peptide [Mangrovihabitans endophyticus]GGK86851.1 hypothetical protein GCM10012284_21250 [Mangrovihabitans endophyticus]
MFVDDGSTIEDAPPWRSAMVDVSGMSLAELARIAPEDDSALGVALRRLLADLDRPVEPVAGFNSAL